MSYQFMIENDHKVIYSLVKELLASASRGLGPHESRNIFAKIIETLKDHFTTEEAAMDQHDYPEAETHRKAHISLLELFHEIGENLVTPDGKLRLGSLQHGESEISEHVCSHDIELTYFLRDKKPE